MFNIDNYEFPQELLDLQEHNQGLFEHLSDHILTAVSFTFLGMLIMLSISHKLVVKSKKIRIDYDLEKGTILRIIHQNNTKRHYIVNPKDFFHILDILILCFHDSKKNRSKVVQKQDMKRIRIIRRVSYTFLIILIISGATLVFSAFETDLNVINMLLHPSSIPERIKGIIYEINIALRG